MIYETYSVYDSKAEAYSLPHHFRSHGEAIRSFESAVADSTSPFHKHPSDFAFFHVGSFNDSNGSIMPIHPPVCLAKAYEVLARQSNAV